MSQVLLTDMLSAFENHLDHHLSNYVEKDLNSVVRYVVKSGGKRIRPLYTLLSTMLSGGDWHYGLDYAVIIELFHNATLFHDDIMDQDAVRRGKESVYVKYSIVESVMSGDLLFGIAAYLAIQHPKTFFEALANTIINTVTGQALQLKNRRNIVDESTCIKIAYLKTGSLFETAMIGGAVAANADKNTIKELAEVGKFIGTAYQLQDDIIGIFLDPNKSGKLVGIDLANGDPTLFVTYTMQSELMPDKDKQYILDIYYGVNSNFDLESIRAIFMKYGILNRVQEKVKSMLNQAKQILYKYPQDVVKEFNQLTDKVFAKTFNL